MGIYLNPGFDGFGNIVNQKIYVDKTLMIKVMNNIIKEENHYICVSRPRRFGKTIAGNMLCAYYSKNCNSRALFEPFKISRDPAFEEGLNKYNVIKIDVGGAYNNAKNRENTILEITKDVRREFTEQFPNVDFDEEDSIANCIKRVFSVTAEQFIIILDEYDVLVRDPVSKNLLDEYLLFLNGLFKDDALRPAIALAYLTGVLPIIRERVQSKLNNFDEYTILNAGPFSEYTGFTNDEVKDLCKKYRMDFEECKSWYDGYRLSWNEGFEERTVEVYNPESVVKSMLKRKFGNYWSKTSNYDVISRRLEQNFNGTKDSVVRMVSGEKEVVDVWSYTNTVTDFFSRDDVFTYLIHLGYLAYDDVKEVCWIPNNEVRRDWKYAIAKLPDYAETDRIIEDSKYLLYSTIRGDERSVEEALNRSHSFVSSYKSYKNEYALHSAIFLAYMYAVNKYICIKEMPAGKGIADIVYIPLASTDKTEHPALIIELKHNKAACVALEQIKLKRYFDALNNYTGEVLFVGINYDEETKTHQCRIERYEKDS